MVCMNLWFHATVDGDWAYLEGEDLVKDGLVGSPGHLSSQVLRQLLEKLQVMLHQMLPYPHLYMRDSINCLSCNAPPTQSPHINALDIHEYIHEYKPDHALI